MVKKQAEGYATPAFALALFKSGMTRRQIAHELSISYESVKRWIRDGALDWLKQQAET